MKRKPSPACPSFHASHLSRRHLLKVGGLGLLGLNMHTLLRAAQAAPLGPGAKPPGAGVNRIAPRAKSVIFLFQWGGPSHVDMFDMKPDAPSTHRSPHNPIKSSAPGIMITEKLPRMAKLMHKVTLIRSVHHTMNNHNSAGYYALTGAAPATDDQRLKDSLDLFPAFGSVVDKLAPLPEQAGLPTFVSYPHSIADGSRTPGQHASFLGKVHDPLFIPTDPNSSDFKLPHLSLPANLTMDRLERRRAMQQLIDQQARMLDWSAEAQGLDSYYEKALGMLNSPKVRQAFDLSKEPKEIRNAYGRTTYGQSCLLARRLVESGVKFVTAYFSNSIGGRSKTDGGWDTHGFDNTRMFPIVEAYHLPITDVTLPTLLEDMDQRGMLEETLVIWMGEFGRTPKINANKSRDHWPQCYTVLMAGGGVKQGYVHGSSDRLGEHPADNPVKPDDIAATIYHLLGIDPATEIHDAEGRPLAITRGKAILDVMV
ncbi:MAG: DUF1501 domain-containing protein [Phycisphaeraceae bacterium]